MMSAVPFVRMGRSRPVQVAAGLASTALGFTVVVAWLIRYEPLIHIHPVFPPMPYSAAIGLLLCGVALLAVAGQQRRLAFGSALSVFVLGLTSLAQHGLGTAWNVDRTILGDLAASIHGGMAPSSALSFVVLGVGLAAVSLNQLRGGFACALCGTTVAAQSGVVFLAYSFGMAGAYRLTGGDIAPHIAMGLAIVGVGTIAAAWHPDQAQSGVPRWLPLPIALGMALISVSLWQQSASDQRATSEGVTLLRAERIGAEINRRASLLIAALVRLADASGPGARQQSPIEPRAIAILDLERFPSLYGIAFFDQSFRPTWTETRDRAALPQGLASVVEVSARSPQADGRPRPTVIDQVELGPGRPGFLIRVPVLDGSHTVGFVVGLLQYDNFFHAAIGEDIGADYSLRVVAGRREIYRLGEAPAPDEAVTGTAAIPFLGSTWQAQIWPRSMVSPGSVANRTLVFGLLFSGLLGWAVQLGQSSARRAIQLTRATASLRTAIADREAAQAAHAESEIRYKQIIDAAADIIYRTDPQGRFIFVNPAAIRVLKWSRDELIGREYVSLIRADYQTKVREFYARQAGERIASTYFDFPAMTADGQEVWIGQHVQLLTEGTRIIGFQAVARDISRRIQIQNELEQTRDAALETARLKSEFVANTSHEIRTPLNGILGFSNLLLSTSLDAEQRTYTDGLRLSADSLLAIVNDILDYSKIEAGMLRLDPVSFDLRAAIDNTIVVMAEAARRKGIGLEIDIEDGLHRRVIGDPSRLRQVLTNLIANAIKFTEQGAVTVRVSTSSEIEDHSVIRFSVHDTGIGIDPDTQNRLFRPFAQADGSSSRYGGTGLGLAICRQLVDLMGGSIGVESTPGGGATFSFTARFDKDADPPVADAHATIDATRMRVLAVADTPSFREELVSHATTWGATAGWAQTGDDALKALREAAAEGKGYDVAILGLVHPQEDCLAVARRIKADPSLTDVKLVFIPLKGMLGDARTAHETGIAAYLPRPVHGSELLRCVTSIMREAAESPRAAAGKATSLVTRHTLDEQRAEPRGRILVTDDTPVSQQVTKLQIEKLGYQVDTAGNGVEAVEAASSGSYSLILMDCQMPVMDGYAATQEIRRRERDGRRTPIVAFTASAPSSGRERCLRAGMDDFLEKPIRSDELIEVLNRWAPDVSPSDVGTASDICCRSAGTEGLVDSEILAALEGDLGPALVNQTIEIHLEQAETALMRIEQAATDDCVDDLTTEAHRLKGGSKTLGFLRIGALCASLEDHADRHTKAERLEVVQQLRQACAEVREWSRSRGLTAPADRS